MARAAATLTTELKPGDTVLFRDYGYSFQVGDTTHLHTWGPDGQRDIKRGIIKWVHQDLIQVLIDDNRFWDDQWHRNITPNMVVGLIMPDGHTAPVERPKKKGQISLFS